MTNKPRKIMYQKALMIWDGWQFDPPDGESVSDVLIPFLDGVSHNKSIQVLDIHIV